MAGWILCMLADGASSGGTCMPCQNLASNAISYFNGPGTEAITTTGNYTGICSFVCPHGTTLQGGGGCFSAYSCIPVTGPIFKTSIQKLVYSSQLAALSDSLMVTKDPAQISITCEMQRDLSLAISEICNSDSSSSTSLQVSTTCIAAATAAATNICNAPAVCVVISNATFTNDYVCAQCPSPPQNGFYAIGELAFSCAVTCSGGFYFNSTSGNCSSCSALETQYCSSGYFMKGQGCYGDPTPFPTLNPYMLSQTNCVLCNKPQPLAGSNQWLWLSDPNGCSYKPCRTLTGVGVTIYIVSDCKNTSDYVTNLCTKTCSPGYWLSGNCSDKSTAICVACTTQKTGYYLIAACSQYADSIWLECGVVSQGGAFTAGYYCTGDGSQQLCPNNKTSNRLASSKGGDCFCPAGTTNGAGGLTCIPTSCPPLQQDPVYSVPGSGGVLSLSYMFTNTQLHTECALCASNTTQTSSSSLAYSTGDGIGLISCVCPPNTYAEKTDIHIISCSSCPSSSSLSSALCSGGKFAGVPDICWAGGTIGTPQCQCIPPPFTTLLPENTLTCGISNSASSCQLGFDLNQAANQNAMRPVEPPTGSALYISRVQSLQGWNIFHSPSSEDTSFNYDIKRIAVTSDLDSWYLTLPFFFFFLCFSLLLLLLLSNVVVTISTHRGETLNVQYVIWIIKDSNALQVYAAPLPPNSKIIYQYDVYRSGDYWNVAIPDSSITRSLEDVAVAAWTVPQSQNRLFPSNIAIQASSIPTDVAVVIKESIYSSQQNTAFVSFWIYLNKIAVAIQNYRVAAWSRTSGTDQRINLQIANDNASIVGTGLFLLFFISNYS